MAVLPAAGMASLQVMAALTVVITVERLGPRPAVVTRLTGMLFIGAGIAIALRIFGFV